LIKSELRGNLRSVIKGESAFVSNPQGLRLWTERFGEPADPVVLLVMGTSAQAIGWPDELVAALVSGDCRSSVSITGIPASPTALTSPSRPTA
jgi:hypothetical protein